MITYNNELWDKLVIEGEEAWKKNHKGMANTLNKLDVQTIVSTMQFFGASSLWARQTLSDLLLAKFRVFDWLAMCVMGRNDDDRKFNNVALKVLVHSFIKSNYNEQEFIKDLRSSDYQMDEAWLEIKIEKS